MGRFTDTANIFANETALYDDYQPDDLLEREAEITDIVTTLQSITNGDRPRNMFIYGQTGTGKTLTTNTLLTELEADLADHPDYSVNTDWVNCRDKSAYHTAISLVNELKDDSEDTINAGYQTSDIHDMLFDSIATSEATHHILVLDEIDHVATDTEEGLLYQLSRAHQHQDLNGTQLSIIGISNNFRFRENLDSQTQSGLCETEVHFSPYDADQLRSIISQRVSQSFQENIVNTAAIAKTAAIAAQDTGSARHALDILHQAGLLARKNNLETITDTTIDEAVSHVQRGRIMDELQELPTQSHYVLAAIISLTEQYNTEAPSTTEIYERYEHITNEADSNGTTLSQRSIHNRLSELATTGFLAFEQVNNGKNGGMYNTYTLEVPADDITEFLNEETRMGRDSNQTTLV